MALDLFTILIDLFLPLQCHINGQAYFTQHDVSETQGFVP